MGQLDLVRTAFEARVLVTVPANDDHQAVSFTGYFNVNDLIDVIEVDASGNVLNILADNLTVLAIDPDVALTLSAAVNTMGLTGIPMIRAQNIDDGETAIDRLYRREFSGNVNFIVREPILAQDLNTPIAGQTTLYVADSRFIRVGDLFDVLADEGIISAGRTVMAVSPNADAINNRSAVVVDAMVDTSGFTNPKLVSTSITIQKAVERNQASIDEIDRPVENEYLGVGDANQTCWEIVNLNVAGTTKFLIDGNRKRLGTAGTRGFLSSGAGDSQMIFTSRILGLHGNDTKMRVQAGAGLTVTVTGTFVAGYTVTVNNNGGAATAKDIALAIEGDAVARRIVAAQWGGTGLGLAATFGPTVLAGGLNDGSGDYAELEQTYNNFIINTGYKFISLHIRANDPNRLNTPPKNDEELVIDYRRPSVNV